MNTSKTNLARGQNVNRFMQTLFILVTLSLFFYACEDQRVQTVTWTEFEPVYMTQQEFDNAVSMDEPRDLVNPGKIYLYGQHLFINDINKGVHIIDNSDPSNPSKVGFITIPANKDIAVKGDLLYADSHSDLLVFDISNMQDAELIAREEGIFQVSATTFPGFPYRSPDPSEGIVVDWEPVQMEETCRGDCQPQGWPVAFAENFNGGRFAAADGAAATPGIGGSMARFAITGDYLYAIDESSLFTFDITDQEPANLGKQNLGWAIETIFPYEQNLFIGSETAMYIYDISNPSAPSELSVFPHMRACDPVVVEGDHAFVTLRSSPRCPLGDNKLEVIDIEDLLNPMKVAAYPMSNPHGLGIDNGNLFITEGEEGLRILDAADPANIQQIRHITDIQATDVILFNNVLIVTGKQGILQYDYSDINKLKLLSTVPVIPDEPESGN